MRYYEREDELENELNRGALWAITYGDMMSYLMIFFMILFAFYSSKKIPSSKVCRMRQTTRAIFSR